GSSVGERVDGVPLHPLGSAAIERAGGDLGGRPRAATAARLVVGDGAVERVVIDAAPRGERERDEGGELGEGFASGRGHTGRSGTRRKRPAAMSRRQTYDRSGTTSSIRPRLAEHPMPFFRSLSALSLVAFLALRTQPTVAASGQPIA